MLKYIKRAYIMSVASYNETPNGGAEEQKQSLKDLSSYDELTNQLLETQKKLLSKPGNKKLLVKLNNILEERKAEKKRLDGLYNPELVTKFVTEQLQNYSAKLNQFQNIRIARQEAIVQRQEKIAEVQNKIKEFGKDMLQKAERMVRYSENPDFKNKGLDLKIEDGKVALYNPDGKRLKYFTIPTMNEDGTINHKENKDRLDNPLVGFNDFVKKYVPEVKTYAEIGQENIKKRQEQEKITALNKNVKEHNKQVLKLTKESISWINSKVKLPEGIEVVLNENKVEIKNKGKIEGYFSLNLKDNKGELIHSENNGRNVYGNLKKWVEAVLEKKKIIPKNSKLDIA